MPRDTKEEVRLHKVIKLQKASNKLQEENNELLKQNIKLQKEALRLKKEATGLGEGFYEVEEIREKRTLKGKPEYLIKWLGWPEEANTWEPLKNLKACLDVVKAFEESLRSGAQGQQHKREGTSQPNKPQKRCKPQSAPAADQHNCVQNVCQTLAERSEPSLSEKGKMVLGEEGLEEQSDAFVCDANLATSVDPDPKVLTKVSPSTKQLTDADDAATASTKAANDKGSSINQQSLCHGNQLISCIPHDPGKLDLLKDDKGFTFKVTSPTLQPNDVFQARGTSPMSSFCRTDPSAVQDTQTSGLLDLNTSDPSAVQDTQTSGLLDLNTPVPSPALLEHPITDLQQVQLRAQIFVYGDLLTGTIPDEACMVYAFGESDGGRNVWESVWRVSVSQNQNSPLSSAKLPVKKRSLFQGDTYSTPDQAGGLGAPLKMLSPLVQELGIKQIEKAQSYSVALQRKNKELQEELKASKQQLEYALCQNEVLQVKLKARDEELESVLGQNNVLREELDRKAINHGAQ